MQPLRHLNLVCQYTQNSFRIVRKCVRDKKVQVLTTKMADLLTWNTNVKIQAKVEVRFKLLKWIHRTVFKELDFPFAIIDC